MPHRGLAVPTPTLFDAEGRLDAEPNRRFSEGVARAGVDHVFALGTLGEFTSVDDEERRPLLRSVRDGLVGASDLWVGVGAPSTRRAVRFAMEAEAEGAEVLLGTPPYYLPPTEAEIASYYRAIAGSVHRPLFAYNIPSKVGYALSPGFVHALAAEGTIVGIKDTSGSLASVRGFLEGAPPGFAVFPGDDLLARPAIEAGAGGAVMGLANIVPRLGVELLRAIGAGDRGAVDRAVALLGRLAEVVHAGPFPSTIKFLGARLRGAPEGYRPPFGPLTPEEQRWVLSALGPIEVELREWV